MRRKIAGVEVRDTTAEAFTRFILRRIAHKKRTLVFFANSNFIIECQDIKRSMLECPELIVLPDGIAMDMASRLLHGRPFRENLNGTDLVPRVLTRTTTKLTVMLIGASRLSVEGAASKLRELPNVEVVGVRDGYSMWGDEEAVLREIEQMRPNLVLVALGNPLQEQWILKHRHRLAGTVVIGVGALLDFLSGAATRAPKWVRSLHMEWAHRWYREPRRLAYRYSIGGLLFMLLTIRHRKVASRYGRVE